MPIGSVLEQEAYRVARKVHHGELSRPEGIKLLADAGMDPNSARNFIYIFRQMMEGVVYRRAMSTGATDFFLERIGHDYGKNAQQKAVSALRQHITYKGGSMPGYAAVANRYDVSLHHKSKEVHPRAQILPMSVTESDGQSIQEVQELYFLGYLPQVRKGSFRCHTVISAAPGSTVLFQYLNRVIAAAQLVGQRPLLKKDKYGYTHELLFNPATIRVFEPVDLAAIQRIWPRVKGLNRARWKLDLIRLSAFERQLRDVRWPPLSDQDAGEDIGAEKTGYVPTGIDSRIVVTAQIRLRRGQYKFREALLARYGRRCVVTGSSIVALLEAAHISPFRGEDDNHEENGLLLRADIHTLFDLNLLGIDPETLRVKLHPSIRSEYLDLSDAPLRCTGNKVPSKAALAKRFTKFRLALGC
jgi:hypothetical protein